MQSLQRHPALTQTNQHSRKGSIVVLAAVMMIMILAFTAFTLDIGYIALTKAQMQNAADAATLAAVQELPDGIGPSAFLSATEVKNNARQAAADLAAAHANGDASTTDINTSEDVRFGRRVLNANTGFYEIQWDVPPYDVVEVTLHRKRARNTELPLFFAPVIGHDDAVLTVKSTARIKPGVGIKVPPESPRTAGVLPIALDLGTWDDLMQGIGPDDWSYDPDTGNISSFSDGVKEVNLYPQGTTALPPGNRGTVDLGGANNSTNDLKRQILHGLNASDLSHFPNNEIRTDQGSIQLNGDTGLSAGIKTQLAAIKGQPRLIPIFTNVSGPGNNATYTIVKFVGVRILDVKLTGPMSKKRVIVQPAPFLDSTVIPGNGVVTPESYYSTHVITLDSN